STQFRGGSIADGAGGGFFVWKDFRNGNADIFAQHLTAAGAVAAGWPANGLAICTNGSAQTSPVVESDGAGGAIIAWSDQRSGNYDNYAMRGTGAGAVAGGTPVN